MSAMLDELKVMLHGVWQRRWMALAVAWGLSLLGWLVVSLIPNSYESRARILVEVNDIVPDATSNPLDQQRRFDQLKDSLTSVRNLAQVVVASGMVDRAADEATRASAAMALQKDTTIVAAPNNTIAITVAVGGTGRSNAENAALAPRVLESMIAQLGDSQVRDGTAGAQQNIRFLDQQIDQVQTRLTDAEQAKAGFEARNLGMLPGAGSPSARAESVRAELGQIDMQLVAVNSQLAATQPTIAVPSLGPTGVGVARQQLASAEAELSGMRARGLTSQHPDVIALTSQIGALRAQAAREGTGVTGGGSQPNPAYAGLVAQRSALGSRRAQIGGELASINASRIQEPAVQAEYDRLNRDYSVIKDQYDRLVARREQQRLLGATESTGEAVRVTVQDPPSVPTTPSKPNKPLLLIGVLVAGLAAGAATAFAMSQVQTTYPTAGRLSQASGLPVLGSVTEILTDDLQAERRRRMGHFALASAGLGAMCVALLALEFVQRGMAG